METVGCSPYAKMIMHARSLYGKIIGVHKISFFTEESEKDKEKIQSIIYDKIQLGKPLMIARLGHTEMMILENLRYTFYKHRSNLRYIMWKGQPNFLNPILLPMFHKLSGFFPSDDIDALKKFYHLMVGNMQKCDILGSWLYNEKDFEEELNGAVKLDRENMTPLLTTSPWTRALKGKRVLVIHPFEDSIKTQYARREKLFPQCPDILPDFELHVIKAVQTVGGGISCHKDWFEALEYMKREMDKIDYDICLLGCGAYGFPLAAYAKECGKQAVHLGGVLQLLFGIKGRRWETDKGYVENFPYAKTYYNDYWIRPSAEECPPDAKSVEEGCYW